MESLEVRRDKEYSVLKIIFYLACIGIWTFWNVFLYDKPASGELIVSNVLIFGFLIIKIIITIFFYKENLPVIIFTENYIVFNDNGIKDLFKWDEIQQIHVEIDDGYYIRVVAKFGTHIRSISGLDLYPDQIEHAIDYYKSNYEYNSSSNTKA